MSDGKNRLPGARGPRARRKPLSPRNGKPRVDAPGRDEITKSDFQQRRIVKPQNPTVRLKPHIASLMADGYTTLSRELEALRNKVDRGEELDKDESRKLVQYLDALAKLAREEREQEKRQDPAQYSEEELVEMLPQVADTLGIPLERLLDKGSEEE